MHPRNTKKPLLRAFESLLTSLPGAGGEADAPTFFVLQRYYTCSLLLCQPIFVEYFHFFHV